MQLKKGFNLMSTLVYDLLLVPLSLFLSVYIKFGGLIGMQEHFGPHLDAQRFQYLLLLIVFLQIALLYLFGPKKSIWRFSSFYDQTFILRGTSLAIFGSIVSFFFLNRVEYFPRSIFVLEWFILTVLMSLGRFAIRFYNERKNFSTSKSKQNILIYGAGKRGESILRTLIQNTVPSPNIVGIIDDNPKMKGANIHGYPILGDFSNIKELCIKYNIEKIILAISDYSSAKLNLLLETTSNWGTKVYNLSSRDFLWDQSADIKKLDKISLEELLGRVSIHLLDEQTQKYFKNKIIMVTGAGGSIGHELCMQIIRSRPKQLLLLEQNEYSLFNLKKSLEKLNLLNMNYIGLMGNILDENFMESTFKMYRPQIIFHAAAYKHVGLVEDNPYCAIQNNILGTKMLAQLACKYQVEKFILISSDKAVNPTSIMGATKRLAEIVCQDIYLNQIEDINGKTNEKMHTAFLTVRFGNVIGSSGSVIPIFKEQIAQGGPVTVTHPKVARYFMSIPEACHLVLKTATIGLHNEIFVLDMGEPIKIYELAKQMIKLAGFLPEKDIDIIFTGLQKGEKLYEEILFSNENFLDTQVDKLKILKPKDSNKLNSYLLDELLELKAGLDPYYYSLVISKILPEYQFVSQEESIVNKQAPKLVILDNNL